MKQKVLIAILAVLTISIAVAVHFTNDKVWQCECFLSKYQIELETIVAHTMKIDSDFCIGSYQYKDIEFPSSVKIAVDTYFERIPNGEIRVLNHASKWRWNIQQEIFKTELSAFYVTYKPYMTYNDAGDEEYRYLAWYLLCYTELDKAQLEECLQAPSDRYDVIETKKPNWFIVVERQQ